VLNFSKTKHSKLKRSSTMPRPHVEPANGFPPIAHRWHGCSISGPGYVDKMEQLPTAIAIMVRGRP